jgi:DNA-binding FrmR family transcriptional regulator
VGYDGQNRETPVHQGGVATAGADSDNSDNTGADAKARARSDQMLEGYMAPEHGYSSQKDNYAKRLRRIEGQVRGIANMIDDDKYCIDVLTQISAATNALRSVALNLLDEHLGHCVTRAVAEGGSEADQKLAEASAAIARLVRS